MDAVSHVIVERRVAAVGLDRMLGWSAVAHVAPLAFVALVPAGWLDGVHTNDVRENVIYLETRGPVGPRDGMTEMPARPVQQRTETDAKNAIEPVRPPAAAEPEMIQPTNVAPKKPEAPIKSVVHESESKAPTSGAELHDGTAVADTKSESTGPGLTSGGSGTGAQLDVGDFCCPEYIVTMQDLINRNWSSKQGAEAVAVMRFTIERDGRLTGITLFKPSGRPDLDFASERALLLTKQLPPLPAAYMQPSLTVHLSFEYQR